MTLPPLTHHEILRLVEPFSRRGRRVDLDATDRMQRRLVWKPVDHPGLHDTPHAALAGGWREELSLENPYGGVFKLTRRLVPAEGPPAELVVEGQHPGELLALADAVAPEQQLRAGPGYRAGLSYLIEVPRREEPTALAAGDATTPAPSSRPMAFTRGVADVAGLTLVLDMPSGRHVGAELSLRAMPGDPLELPEDLLAVLGWDWAPLLRGEPGTWNSRIRIRGKGAGRRRQLEERMARTVEHLARTLGEPPRRFHQRFFLARWWASFRRAIPVWTGVFIVVGALAMPKGFIEGHPVLRAVLMHLPILILVLSFTLQEMARVELPRFPRALRAPSWRPSAEVA